MIKRVLSKLRKVTMSLFAVLCAGAVWAEEGEVTYVTSPMQDPTAGYIRTGLGKKGNEVAVVFTNHTKTATWTVPANLYNVEFLVVGGGGGGGADNNDDVRMAGSGGGGGGVVTGLVNFVEGSIVSATVGKGGEGGFVEKKPGTSSYNYWGAAKLAGASTFGVGSDVYVTANAGGRDLGASATSYTSGTNGGSGGSGAGGRQKKNGGSATKGSGDNNFVVFYEAFGNNGGKGSTKDWYSGSANSGGGGGGAHPDPALGTGGDAGWTEEGEWFGGKGGEGLTSNITGFDVVYGSGGGGGNVTGLGGVAGEGAGDGNTANISGKGANYGRGNDALQNQGGGGGGGGRGDGPRYQKRGGGNGGSGIVVLRYSVYEAEVVTAEGSTLYATFAEAFEVAQAGETVKLLNDVTLTEKLTIKKAVTLDLNGCTLSETVTDNYGALYVGTAGNLTITDSAEGGKIATDGGIVVGNYGTVTVNGGTIEAGENPEVDVSVYNFYYNGSTYGKLTVTGGTVGCIWNCGAVTVSGGTVDYVDTTGEMTVAEGATIGELLLKVGDYNSELPNKETLVAPETFVVKTLDGSCALYRDGKWVVVDATGTPFLVGETGYATLAEAFDAVDEGGVITLLSNVTGPGLVINKSVTIDFNNKTYTFDQGVGNIPSNGFQILKDNTVTLKNGTLQIAESAKKTFYTVIQNYANLTLNNMTVDGTNTDKWSTTDGDSYAVSLNCGTVSIEGATTIKANDEGDKAFAFDVCQFKSYNPPTVTLNTTGTISGKVEVSGGDLVIGAENTATLSAIDFTAGSVKGDVESILTIPEDKKLAEDEDGAFILVDKVYAAQVGEQKFETFAEALAAANGNAITLLADVEADFEVAGAVEINLNGFDVKCSVTLTAVDSTLTAGAELPNATMVAGRSGYNVSYADGVYSLTKINVAMIEGGDTYGTLGDALAAAAADATVKLIADTEETVTVPAGFAGTIDLGGFTLKGRIDSYATGAVLKNGSVIHTTGSKAAIQIEAGSLELTDINMESNYHGVRLNGAGTTATINSGTYRITSSSGTYNLIYASKANAKFYVYGGEFYNNGDTGSTWVLKSYASGSEINVYGGTFSAYSANTFEVANGGVIKVFGGTFTGCNPSATTHATVQPGYAVEGTGPWTVVASWTAPMPEKDGEAPITEEYTPDVLAVLEAAVATSVDVKVNGVELKGNEAVKALNAAVASFDNALTFDGTAATLDIEIEVTEVNTEDPAASTVVVKRGTEELTVKVTPTVKYFYPETKTWGSDKPESGAVLFKLVF